jgi:hypothetical protein
MTADLTDKLDEIARGREWFSPRQPRETVTDQRRCQHHVGTIEPPRPEGASPPADDPHPYSCCAAHGASVPCGSPDHEAPRKEAR